MQQDDLLEVTWPYDSMDISFDGVELYDLDMYNDVTNFEFLENSSNVSSPNQYFSSGFSDNSLVHQEFATSSITSKERRVLDQYDSLSKNKMNTVEIPSAQWSLVLPQEDGELDTKLSFFNLIKAYGEAMENGQVDLVEAIVARLEEKGDPTGETSMWIT